MSNRFFIRILAAAFLPLLVSCSGNSYKIVGHAPDYEGTAYLTYSDLEGGSWRDSTSVKGGEFVFEGSIDDAYHGQVVVTSEGNPAVSAFLVLEKGVVNIEMAPDAKPVVLGTKNNDFLAELDKAVAIDSNPSPEAFRKAMLECIQSHKDCEYAAFLYGCYFADQPLDQFVAEFETFPEEVRSSALTANVRRDIEARRMTAEGTEAPDFALKDRDGNEVVLSSFRGGYVVVDFWASWCGPCRRGVPGMKDIYAKYHEKGLEIIGVSVDTDRDSWIEAVDEDKTEWIHVIDEVSEGSQTDQVASRYGVRAIPAYFLIDREGRFLGKFDHDQLEQQLSKLLD